MVSEPDVLIHLSRRDVLSSQEIRIDQSLVILEASTDFEVGILSAIFGDLVVYSWCPTFSSILHMYLLTHTPGLILIVKINFLVVDPNCKVN